MKRRKIRKSLYECLIICGAGIFVSSSIVFALLAADVENAPSLIGADICYANNMEIEAEENDIPVEEVVSKELSIEEKIERACEDYGVSYDLAIAIARLETGWFTSEAYIYGNNPGGMSVNEIPIVYESIEEGVDAFVRNLKENYISEGLTTPEEIGPKYCPINPDWDDIVIELMKEN